MSQGTEKQIVIKYLKELEEQLRWLMIRDIRSQIPPSPTSICHNADMVAAVRELVEKGVVG